MGTQHTPGPWLYRPQQFDDWGTVRTAPDAEGRMRHICRARDPRVSEDGLGAYRANKTDPYEANARLIAAAPDLLEVCERVLERGYVSKCIEEEREDHLALKAAIAKARGQ